MKKSGVKILQEYWDGIRNENQWEYKIKWIPNKGYYADTNNDHVKELHFLGVTVREARIALKFYAAPRADYRQL